MATIQIKRRTSEGTGPLVGTAGTIKAGEPQVDFSGEHLYIAKGDKNGSSGTPLLLTDYLKIPGVNKVNTQIDTKLSALNLGSASTRNVGTASGCVPFLNSDGKLADGIVPKIAITNTYVVSSQSAMLALSNAQEGDVAVRTDLTKSYILKAKPYSTLSNWQELLSPTDAVTSVNGSTGVVTISLSGLGGLSASTYHTHVGSDLHLTDTQRLILQRVNIAEIADCIGTGMAPSKSVFNTGVLSNAIKFFPEVDDEYVPSKIKYNIGIDSTKVLTPSSVIDGGTY